MARRPRPNLAGGLCHVIQRGNYRQRYLRFVYAGMGKGWKPDPVEQVFWEARRSWSG